MKKKKRSSAEGDRQAPAASGIGTFNINPTVTKTAESK